MGDMLSLWLKDSTTIGRHMVNIRRVTGDTRGRQQWERALDGKESDSGEDDEDEDEV